MACWAVGKHSWVHLVQRPNIQAWGQKFPGCSHLVKLRLTRAPAKEAEMATAPGATGTRRLARLALAGLPKAGCRVASDAGAASSLPACTCHCSWDLWGGGHI